MVENGCVAIIIIIIIIIVLLYCRVGKTELQSTCKYCQIINSLINELIIQQDDRSSHRREGEIPFPPPPKTSKQLR